MFIHLLFAREHTLARFAIPLYNTLHEYGRGNDQRGTDAYNKGHLSCKA